jgi:gamma-glutamyltranspeptidase/glutathione hydrolase
MQDRYAVSGDPEFVEAPVAELLSAEYGERRAREILTDRALLRSEIKPGLEPVAAGSGSTTHLSVVDAEGNAVSLTQTLGGFFGCGTTIPGTGIVMNDQMKNFSRLDGSPNRFAPGKAMNSTQAPTIVLKDGELEFVIGSPGNYRILTTVVQMLVMRLDQKMDLAAATVAPRIAARHYGAIDVEGGWPDGVVEGLEARGHEVATHPPMDLYFGGTHAITRDPATGMLHAVADPRRDGDAGALP